MAFIKATKRRHRTTTCSVLPRRLPWRQKKTTIQYVSTLLTITMVVSVRRYNTAHIARWGRSMAFIKATKRRHRAIHLRVSGAGDGAIKLDG